MKFTIAREALLKPLNLVAGVAERRQTMAILSNVLLVVKGDELSITGTDLEVELIGRVRLASAAASDGEITVPGRKLAEICKSLQDGSELQFALEDQRLVVRSGRSRFALTTLPASEYPSVDQGAVARSFDVRQGDLRRLIDRTSFAMAQQDVRYYLNGMLWEVEPGVLRVVATDGHRLALCRLESAAIAGDGQQQLILPRKGVIELARLLMDEQELVTISIGGSHLRAATASYVFTSKLVDGKFPDYQRVLPRNSSKTVYGAREELRAGFARAAILSNEKYRGVRLTLGNGSLQIVANNPEQEEAEEVVTVDYQGESLEIGFNVSYLLDVLSVLSDQTVKLSLADANSSVLLEESSSSDSLYVVMPMRL